MKMTCVAVCRKVRKVSLAHSPGGSDQWIWPLLSSGEDFVSGSIMVEGVLGRERAHTSSQEDGETRGPVLPFYTH